MHDEQQNRKKRRRLKKIAVLPSLITLLNGLCGFAAIHFAARGMNEPGKLWLEKPTELSFFAAAAWMIFFAMVADSLDGFVARKSGWTSDFGGQLDSLSDVISFGVAPAFLMLRVVENALHEQLAGEVSPLFGGFMGRLLWLAAAMYVCCALLRLARFNIENTPDESSHMNFSGLPSPAAAGVVAAMVLLYSDLVPEFQEQLPELSRLAPIIIYLLPFVTVAVALLMVSRIPYSHVVNQYIRGRKSFGYVVAMVLLMLLLYLRLQGTLVVFGLIYALSGVVRMLWKKTRPEKNTVKPPVDSEQFKIARLEMVAEQLRRKNIRNESVLKVMEQLPREHFIPEPNRSGAYMDQPAQIGLGQTISQPYIVALMTEKLDVRPGHRVLEIGYGCGYQTAILAMLCREVFSIELLEELARLGRENLESIGINNVRYHTGDGRQGWPEPMEFDRILVAAATREVPPALVKQLKNEGKMVVPVGDHSGQRLLLLEKQGSKIQETFLCYCHFVRLV